MDEENREEEEAGGDVPGIEHSRRNSLFVLFDSLTCLQLSQQSKTSSNSSKTVQTIQTVHQIFLGQRTF